MNQQEANGETSTHAPYGALDQIRERAARRAYGRIYPTLNWLDASVVGRQYAFAHMKAADVLAVIETDLVFDTPQGVVDLGELHELIGWMDDHLDAAVADTYKDQPLAQDWARVAKVAEEAGEAVDALIGVTGQNPRKGHYGSRADLLSELADVALTGLYAMQHFTKNRYETVGLLMDRARYHRARVEALTERADTPASTVANGGFVEPETTP